MGKMSSTTTWDEEMILMADPEKIEIWCPELWMDWDDDYEGGGTGSYYCEFEPIDKYKQPMLEYFRSAPTSHMKSYLFYSNFYEEIKSMPEKLGKFICDFYGLHSNGASKRITLDGQGYLIMYTQDTVKPMRGNFMMGEDRRYIHVMKI